jgi:hypothetical protein
MKTIKELSTVIKKHNGDIELKVGLIDDRIVLHIESELNIDFSNIVDFKVWSLKKLGMRANSHKKIRSFMEEVFTKFKEKLEKTEFLGKNETHTVLVENCGNYVLFYFYGNIHEIPKQIIEDELHRKVSWYFHDIYNEKEKELSLTIRTDNKSKPTYIVSSEELYDMSKLRKLRESDIFKQKKFSFFFYDNVLSILGEGRANNQMSGLF